MSVDPWTVLTILGMAVAAYACRGGGYWLFSKIRPTPQLKSLLSYIPGSLFVSYVVPGVANGGPKEWIGAAVAVAVAIVSGSMIWPVFVGTAAVWIAWLLL